MGPSCCSLVDAVKRVLADEESGEGGWGPDVTAVMWLSEALESHSHPAESILRKLLVGPDSPFHAWDGVHPLLQLPGWAVNTAVGLTPEEADYVRTPNTL